MAIAARRRDGGVAYRAGLENRIPRKRDGGSNPSLSAIFLFRHFPRHHPTAAGTGCARRDRISTPASERFLRRGLRRSTPAAGSGGTGPRDRRRTKTTHYGEDFRDSGRSSVRQSRREVRGSNRPPPLPNRPRLCGPPAALHFPPPEPAIGSGGFRLRPAPCGANTTADKRNSLHRLRADKQPKNTCGSTRPPVYSSRKMNLQERGQL